MIQPTQMRKLRHTLIDIEVEMYEVQKSLKRCHESLVAFTALWASEAPLEDEGVDDPEVT